MRMFRAGQRNHGVTMGKRREVLFQFVRRAARRDEMNFVEIEAAIGGAGDREMAVVDGVERAAKKRDTARMMFSGGAVRLGDGQCDSVEDACSLFSCGSGSKSSAECATFGILSRASPVHSLFGEYGAVKEVMGDYIKQSLFTTNYTHDQIPPEALIERDHHDRRHRKQPKVRPHPHARCIARTEGILQKGRSSEAESERACRFHAWRRWQSSIT